MYFTIGAKVRTRRSRIRESPVCLYCVHSSSVSWADIRPGLSLAFRIERTPYSRGKFAAGLKFRLARMTSAHGLRPSSAEARNRIRSNPQRALKKLTNPPVARNQPRSAQACTDGGTAHSSDRGGFRGRQDLRPERERGGLGRGRRRRGRT